MAPTAMGASSTGVGGVAVNGAGGSTSGDAPGSLEEATQRYQTTKLGLRTGLANKRLIDRSLVDLESQIYLFEGSYLQCTASSGGNIVKGFDGYLKNSSTSTATARTAHPTLLADIPLEDRIFSLSSATYQKSLEFKANESLTEQERDSDITPKSSKNSTTPADLASSTPTPVIKKSKKDKDTASTSAATNTPSVKKKKDKDATKENERSATPQIKNTPAAGKNADAANRASTPTKSIAPAGGKAATTSKLKRKLTDATTSAATASTTKPVKRKKDED
ncbi:uncharacterized protein UMAG_04384 [Mycosarcoma maydis]|uniref:Chromatin modification-related protein EAF6 n=1 Tax=Mycosarcoma maydis TaxID=5270 RepID=A0A0D1CKB6_MYCMD|nr:uncharacterized protein UMAG_04384 [Ustilago maydis 521]KIS67283.1 hypothetical protein UMAG_04384 [Ustilago maydis 521]|eukprot:XP_011391086.1 hypothetical protein UMAG_04384 [Ustilago maydis 521]